MKKVVMMNGIHYVINVLLNVVISYKISVLLRQLFSYFPSYGVCLLPLISDLFIGGMLESRGRPQTEAEEAVQGRVQGASVKTSQTEDSQLKQGKRLHTWVRPGTFS